MTQAELEREVADLTGESRDVVRHRGFSLVVMPHRKPRTVNWDSVQAARRANGAARQRRRPVAA